MRKIIFILFVAFLSLSFTRCSSNEKALNEKLENMAAGLNESAPVMLDHHTRFEGALVLPGNLFRYRYTVLNTSNPDSLVERGLRSLKENIGKEFSSNSDLRFFKMNNVTIEYVYDDGNGRTIRSLRIEPDDYR